MELPSNFLEEIAFITRRKIEEHMLIVMDKSILKDFLAQPLQKKIKKQFKIAVTFLTSYNGTFNVTNSNDKFYFKRSNKDDDFNVISIPSGAYKLESSNDEIMDVFIQWMLIVTLQWMLILVTITMKHLGVEFKGIWWNVKILFQVLFLNKKLKTAI